MSLLAKVLQKVEDGRSIGFVYAAVILMLSLYFLFNGLGLSDKSTVTYTPISLKQQVVKKVSSLPKEKKQEEQTKQINQESQGEIEQIRSTYINYVIQQIEKNKIYPLKEQSLGHEGSVKFILELSEDGTVKRLSFVRRSIYGALNEASITAVKKAHPFDSFPPQLKEKKIRIPVMMDYYIK